MSEDKKQDESIDFNLINFGENEIEIEICVCGKNGDEYVYPSISHETIDKIHERIHENENG